jgi:diguanylate cyclase (GGDEF)-like protein
MCDLDGFKDVNDRFGHQEGNRILKAVASVLRQSCRPYDYVARLGGDEFVVVLPDTGREAVALKVAEFRQNCALAGRQLLSESNLSLSAGCAVFPDDGVTAEALLAEADSRMYEDKRRRKEIAAYREKTVGGLLPLAKAAAATENVLSPRA